MTDSEHIHWIIARFVNLYKENPNVDYLYALREIAERVEKAERFGVYPWGPGEPFPKKPEPTHFTITEGGLWHPWEIRYDSRHLLYSIKFADGSVFDTYLGWRPTKGEAPCEPALPGPTAPTSEPNSPPSSPSATQTDSTLSALLADILSEVRIISKNLQPFYIVSPPAETESNLTSLDTIQTILDLSDGLTPSQFDALLAKLTRRPRPI